VTYALRRGRQWISATKGQGEGQLLPPVLALCDTAEAAWLADSLEQALERQTLLRNCWGWATEVRAFR
jgi:hypothetical protein